MDLNEKGWLGNYLAFRQNAINPELLKSRDLPQQKDEIIYRTIQPMGIMYGHPVLPDYISSEKLENISVNERMKVVLLECFIQSSDFEPELLLDKNSIDFSYELAKDLINYYLQIFPELETDTHSFFGKLRKKEDIAEKLLNKRLVTKRSMFENIWVSYFHNSLLFIDVFFFKTWLEKSNTLRTLESLRKEKDDFRLSLLKIIAAAAYADKQIEKEEKKLFLMFLKSAHLDVKTSQEAKRFIDEKLTIDDIDFPDIDSWLLKKYFLELAILTVWSDKVVNDEEHEFIQQLSRKLGFSKEETENSMVAIESFVLTNWDDMYFFLKNKDYEVVGKLFVKQITKVAAKNKDRIATEIKESKELMELMTASLKRDLNTEEKEKVREQLIDLLKMLPTFVIIALPGTFLTLPLMLKILPKGAWPSAFQK